MVVYAKQDQSMDPQALTFPNQARSTPAAFLDVLLRCKGRNRREVASCGLSLEDGRAAPASASPCPRGARAVIARIASSNGRDFSEQSCRSCQNLRDRERGNRERESVRDKNL